MNLETRKEFLKELCQKLRPSYLEGYRFFHQKNSSQFRGAIKEKSSFNDIVTEWDSKIEEMVKAELKQKFPSEKILGEESIGSNREQISSLLHSEDKLWILDPIDGTTNFSKSYPFFSLSLAYAEKNSEGNWSILAGVVYDPVKNEEFLATKGHGATLNGKKISVSPESELKRSLIVTGITGKNHPEYEKSWRIFRQATENCLGSRRDGSAALDLAYVACGRVDAYWEWGLSPWDLAAGSLLVQEAGGNVSTFSGAAWELQASHIVATNHLLLPELTELYHQNSTA